MRFGAPQPQHLDVAAGPAHRIDQPAGIDELPVVARLRVRQRQPEAARRTVEAVLRRRCGR
ncbi:hypothetical protein B7486_79365 [cyanobacterium TDX16]|nr:hypothetical protein B7486_79365 [cyanobacterium TDX16]